MSAEWIGTTVGEYSPFIYGKAIKKADQLNEGISVYGSNGVYAFSAEALVEQHAVIIGRKGSVGKVHLSTKPCWISDTAFYTTKDTIEEAYFVYYLLSSLGLEDMNTDAAVPGLNRNNAHRLEIKIPSTVEERVALVEPLINLDKKIELNRQTNQTLEQIAQAIFKSWFVDFEPTRAKIIAKEQGANLATQELAAQAIICGAITLEQLAEVEQNLETTLQQAIDEKLNQHNQANPTALNAQQLKTTAALFPNELVESELGEIPEGWELTSVDEICDFQNGYAFKSKDMTKNPKDTYKVFKMGHIKKGGGLNQAGTKDFYDKEKCDKLGRYLIKKGDLLMCMTDMKNNVALLGHTALMDVDDEYILNQRVGLLRSKDIKKANYPFLYILTNSEAFIDDLRSRANSGVQVNLSTKEIKDTKFILPSEDVHIAFDQIVKKLREQIFSLEAEQGYLAEIRDVLLPKLLSGEIELIKNQNKEVGING